MRDPLGTALMWLYSGIPADQKQVMTFITVVDAPVGAIPGLSRAAATLTPERAFELNALRLSRGAEVTARFDLAGDKYLGTNLARSNQPIKGTFDFFVKHAEGDAMSKAIQAGNYAGKSGTLFVTENPCRFCVGGISTAARSMGVSELRIVTPNGLFGIYTPQTGLVVFLR